MCKRLYDVYTQYDHDPKVKSFILRGAGAKGLCAGGDVVKIATGTQEERNTFFKQEYITDYTISQLTKPHVAICDGIVMGGGFGVSMHGTFSVATERTVFAMPETEIGLFPDVGASYLLPKLPNHIGLLIGLVGQRLHGYDLKSVGLCTHYVDSRYIEEMIETISCDGETKAGINDIITHYEQKTELKDQKSFNELYGSIVNTHFSNETMEEIVASLESSIGHIKSENTMTHEQGVFLTNTLSRLRQMSPSSCKLTLELFKAGKSMSLKQAFQTEFRVGSRLTELPDFQEGVIKKLIDKTPAKVVWSPNTFEQVDLKLIQGLFNPIPNELVLP